MMITDFFVCLHFTPLDCRLHSIIIMIREWNLRMWSAHLVEILTMTLSNSHSERGRAGIFFTTNEYFLFRFRSANNSKSKVDIICIHTLAIRDVFARNRAMFGLGGLWVAIGMHCRLDAERYVAVSFKLCFGYNLWFHWISVKNFVTKKAYCAIFKAATHNSHHRHIKQTTHVAFRFHIYCLLLSRFAMATQI